MCISNLNNLANKLDKEFFGKTGKVNNDNKTDNFKEAVQDGKITQKEFKELKENFKGDAKDFENKLSEYIGKDAVKDLKSSKADPVELKFDDAGNVKPKRKVIEISNESVVLEKDNKVTVSLENFKPSEADIKGKISQLNKEAKYKNNPLKIDNDSDRVLAIQKLAMEHAQKLFGDSGFRTSLGTKGKLEGSVDPNNWTFTGNYNITQDK